MGEPERIQEYFEAIADSKVRAAFNSLNVLIENQQEMIEALKARVQHLEEHLDP